ncbi:dihydrofolate reductase [Mesorhizobium soli]|uniref:dihydrofolate reductase family protein n=1 Tax=Pseudaminobacter soli (ex Li et al. 2025) TaxID=1295366 RepID=UPI0024736A8E|nr:dihydrofolate reductase family protein [Mesorhizobium soli]MDH6234451.1 dihydrofolate reductase [Mesorhizobium soli]
MATIGKDDVIYNFAVSLDGFIAREGGSFDWLNDFPADNEFGFDAFMASVTGIVMGGRTYDVVRRHSEWAYGDYPCLVATSHAPHDLPSNTEAMSGTPAELIANLRDRGAKGRIWMFGGGDLARQFLDAGLLDTVEIGIIPIVLGSGIAAFGGKQPDRWLDLVFAKPLANGAIHAQYRVRR